MANVPFAEATMLDTLPLPTVKGFLHAAFSSDNRAMSDELFTFEAGDDSAHPVSEPLPKLMTASQRAIIRDAFGKLGLATAREQFDVVEEMTGVRITAVSDLEQSAAQSLIYRLESRVKTANKKNTGNSWDDRDEDTWIDKL